MPRVYHRVRKQRTQFNKLPFGAPYWLASSISGQPRQKYGRTGYINGWNTDGSVLLGTEAALNVAVVKVPEAFLAQNEINE